jgi:hypothetical protein
MPFGTATVVTTIGKAMIADRVRATPSLYANPPKFGAMGVGATGAGRTAAVTDTALSSEVETRATAVETLTTTTGTNDTLQSVSTIAATAGRSVDEFGLFDASFAGNMFFSATFPVQTLVSGDALQITAKVKIG